MKKLALIIVISILCYIGAIAKLSEENAKDKRQTEIKDSINQLKIHK